MTPIFKKDDPSVVSNYRHISLLNAVGKVLEKVIHKYLFNYIRDHKFLALQSGFISGGLIVNQPVDIYNTFCKALEKGKEVLCFSTYAKHLTVYGTEAVSLKLSLLGFLIHYFHG